MRGGGGGGDIFIDPRGWKPLMEYFMDVNKASHTTAI